MNKFLLTVTALGTAIGILPTIHAHAARSTGGSAGAGQGYGAISGFVITELGYDVGATAGRFGVTSVHFRIVHQGGALVDSARVAVNVILHGTGGAATTVGCTAVSSNASCAVPGVSVESLTGITVEAHNR